MIGHLESAVEHSKRTQTPDELKREEAYVVLQRQGGKVGRRGSLWFGARRYRLAEDVDEKLNSMNSDLLDIIQTLNKATETSLDSHNPVRLSFLSCFTLALHTR